jgi:hypothetical protein
LHVAIGDAGKVADDAARSIDEQPASDVGRQRVEDPASFIDRLS